MTSPFVLNTVFRTKCDVIGKALSLSRWLWLQLVKAGSDWCIWQLYRSTNVLHASFSAKQGWIWPPAGFYTKLNVWGSLGLNFEYDGGPIIEIGGPIFLDKLRIFQGSTSFHEGLVLSPGQLFWGPCLSPFRFLGGHLKFLRATYYHQWNTILYVFFYKS